MATNGGNGYLKPSSRGKRDPLSNAKNNGRIVNPPRMAELGGLSSVRKKGAMRKNELTIRKPGGSA
jgi:hypothetical protein